MLVFCRWVFAYSLKKDQEREKRREALRNAEEDAAATGQTTDTANQSVKSDEEEASDKPKKEKLGFRDRKVNTN